MLLLTLCIASSAAIALIFKGRERAGMNRFAVLGVNYAVCVTLGIMMLAISGFSLPAFNLGESWGELGRTLSEGGKLSPSGSLFWALVVGAVGGSLYFSGFLCYQISINRHGVSLAGAFIKLGILVPISLSLIIWREFPNAAQWWGISLALMAIGLVFWPVDKDWRSAIKPMLITLFFLGGAADFTSKIFQQYGLPEYREHFLLFIFGSALIFSCLAIRIGKRSITRHDVITGLMIGLPNYFSAYFLLRSLEHISAVVVFAAVGAGSILLINLGGLLFFKEKLSAREWIAMGFTATALILINL